MRTNMYLTSAAMCLTLAVHGVAAPDTQVPFKGSFQGQETDVAQGNLLLVNGSVTGVATHFGRFTMTYNVTVPAPPGSATGSGQLTAANGDMIFYTIVGVGVPVAGNPNLADITETNTITGGTGRFAGATGNFIVTRLVDLATGLTSGTFTGMITSPGAAH